MKIVEPCAHVVEDQDFLLAPVKQPLFVRPVFYDPVEHLADEHGDGVLEDVVADSDQGVLGCEVPYGIQGGPGAFIDIGFQDIHRQKKRSRHPFPETSDEKSPSSVFSAQGMDYQRVFTDLCRVQNDDVRVDCHGCRQAWLAS